MGLRAAIAPTGEVKASVRTPGVYRRINAQAMRTGGGPGRVVRQREVAWRIPERIVNLDTEIGLNWIRGHRIYRRAGEIRRQVDCAAVVHYVKSFGIGADSAGQVVRRIDEVPEILAGSRIGSQSHELADDVVLAGKARVGLRIGGRCDAAGAG